MSWIEAEKQARELVDSLPPDELGCLFLDDHGLPVTPKPATSEFSKLTRHYGAVGGVWPRVLPDQ